MKCKIEIGHTYIHSNEDWKLLKIISINEVLIENVENKLIKAVSPDELKNNKEPGKVCNLDNFSDEEWEIALRRHAIIQELNEALNTEDKNSTQEIIKKISIENKVSVRTIYRWKSLFEKSELISALVPQKSSGGRGKGRVTKDVEKLILDVINEFHFKNQRRKVSKSYRELVKRCRKLDIPTPSINTFSSRIDFITRRENLEKRMGKSFVHQKSQPVPGNYPEVQSPLEVVQIDHTILDIIVVDEKRRPIGRPYITLGIDLYSRMVTGFYISFDAPGSLGTGICISSSLLPKDQVLLKYKLKSDWPINGRIMNIHTDNAPEFKSKSLMKACQEYGINLLYRGKGKTHWGGHIEKLLGTFLSEIHLIPGTTFSNTNERRDYDSEKESVLTLSELEEWLHIFIVDIYHQNPHSTLGISPILKYYEGIYSSNDSLPSGIGNFDYNHLKLKIDFLPSIERTIQRTGVVIDHIRYYSDILSQYIYFSRPTENLHYPKKVILDKFQFKRDPRDLSCIYFLDPIQNQYFPIFYANKTRPSISIWEHRIALKEVRKNSKLDPVTEDLIFEAFEKMDQIISNAKQLKNKAKSIERRKKHKDYITFDSDVTNFESIDGPDFNNIEIFTHSDEL